MSYVEQEMLREHEIRLNRLEAQLEAARKDLDLLRKRTDSVNYIGF